MKLFQILSPKKGTSKEAIDIVKEEGCGGNCTCKPTSTCTSTSTYCFFFYFVRLLFTITSLPYCTSTYKSSAHKHIKRLSDKSTSTSAYTYTSTITCN